MSLDLENMSIEDFDEKLASLRDIIEDAISVFYGLGEDHEAHELQTKLNKEMNE